MVLVVLMAGTGGSSGQKKTQASKHARSAEEEVSEYEALGESATESEEWDTTIEAACSSLKGKEQRNRLKPLKPP